MHIIENVYKIVFDTCNYLFSCIWYVMCELLVLRYVKDVEVSCRDKDLSVTFPPARGLERVRCLTQKALARAK